MAEAGIRVLVVDDHEMVRLGLITYLQTEPGIDVVGEAAGGQEAVRLAQELAPDVILMDLVMPEMDGVAATKEIKENNPSVQVIVLTSFVEDSWVFPALEAGAAGYLLKTARAEEIAQAIFSVSQGQSILDPEIMEMLKGRNHRPRALHQDLTERERDVLRLIADGLSNQEIADTLHIGIKTVKTHVSNILDKLQVKDRTQAAVYAHRHGLAKGDDH